MNRALARETRIRHPPEKSLVFLVGRARSNAGNARTHSVYTSFGTSSPSAVSAMGMHFSAEIVDTPTWLPLIHSFVFCVVVFLPIDLSKILDHHIPHREYWRGVAPSNYPRY